MTKTLLLVSALAALTVVPAGHTRTTGYTASVNAPPKIQRAGGVYLMTIIVRNNGPAIRPFCVDFTDDHGSWDINMGGLSIWNSDTFCLALPGYSRKTLAARLIPARPGTRTLKVMIGKAKVYRDVRRAIIVDNNALSWQGQFVIIS